MKKQQDKILSAIVVDDERLARKELISMLDGFDTVNVVGEADSVEKAVIQIKKTNPDIIFLDIQMPGKSGFDLINDYELDARIVFVTAYDEYAIRAFEVNAMDYLLKPVSYERLTRSIDRLFDNAPPPEVKARDLYYDDRLFIEFGRSIRFLTISEIICIHAEGDYTMVQIAKGDKGLVTKSMKEWEERLPEKHFCRIHRSTIINLEYIENIEKYFNYSYTLSLKGIKEPLIISRRYAKKLKEIFG